MSKREKFRRLGTEKTSITQSPISSLQLLFVTAFLGGLLLDVASINIYRVTVISWRTSLMIILVVGLVTTLLGTQSKRITTAFQPGGTLLLFFYFTVSLGSSATYLFLATNYYLADSETASYTLPILERYSMPGPKGHRSERQPLVSVNYFGEEKELVFSYAQTAQVLSAREISLSVQKGKLGFDVISSQKLIQ